MSSTTLPTPAVVEPLDYEAILAAHRADLVARHPAAAAVLDLESEPLTKLIESHAYRELLYRQRVNDAARARLLAFATGADLDHLGDLYGAPRLPGEADERYRSRLRLVIRALAGNGTREAYEARAMAVSLDVQSARATQPAPGSVLLLVWPRAGADAAALMDAVRTAFDQPEARILGVNFAVAQARAKPIDVTALFRLDASAPPDLLAQLQALLPARLAAYAQLGRDVPRSWITAQLHVDGVVAVRYPEPATPADITPMLADEYPVAGALHFTREGG